MPAKRGEDQSGQDQANSVGMSRGPGCPAPVTRYLDVSAHDVAGNEARLSVRSEISPCSRASEISSVPSPHCAPEVAKQSVRRSSKTQRRTPLLLCIERYCGRTRDASIRDPQCRVGEGWRVQSRASAGRARLNVEAKFRDVAGQLTQRLSAQLLRPLSLPTISKARPSVAISRRVLRVPTFSGSTVRRM